MKKLALPVALCLLIFAMVFRARAESQPDALLDLLIHKGLVSREEADSVRAEWEKQIAARVAQYEKVKAPSWIDEMIWGGDLRLRAEYIDYEDADNRPDRLRYRVRLRLGFESRFREWAAFGFRLSTGGEDPVSLNQSFQDTFKRKPINIDLVYITLQPPGWDWLTVTSGKMRNPIWQTALLSPLQFDHDVTPEGVAEQFSLRFGDKRQHKLFANFGQFVVDEISDDSNDVYAFEFQGGMEANFPDVRATVAAGYSLTHNLDRLTVGDSPTRGNVVNGGFFLDDFQVVTARGELSWNVSTIELLGTPFVVTLSAEYIKNLADAYESAFPDPDQTDGFAAQIALGEARRKGQWQLAYQYKHIEADATWDAVADSDWGEGGTDRKGHMLRAAYNFQDWWQLVLTASVTEKLSDRLFNSVTAPHNQRGRINEDLLRLQLDSVWRF